MGRSKKVSVNILLTLSILMVFFLLCLGMSYILRIHTLIPAIFTLAVFLISLISLVLMKAVDILQKKCMPWEKEKGL